MRLIKHFFVLLITLVLATSCSKQISLKSDEIYLYAIEFEHNKVVSEEKLASLIPISQHPNTRPLNLPITPRVVWLNYGQKHFDTLKFIAKKEKLLSEYAAFNAVESSTSIERKKNKIFQKLNRIDENLQSGSAWFWRYIGEKPAIIQTSEIRNTSLIIEQYLRMSGYRDAVVDYSTEFIKKNRSKLIYKINEGTLYKIDSVEYEIQDAQLRAVVLEKSIKKNVQPNDPFDINLINAERNRIELEAKKNGYFQFSNQYIRHGATNAKGSLLEFKNEKKGNLYFEISNPLDKPFHQKFKVTSIEFKGIELNQLDSSKIDTIEYNDIRYIISHNQIPLRKIDDRILIRPNSLYNIVAIQETQRQLGLLNQFAFISYQVEKTTDSTLKIAFFSPLLDKFNLSFTPGINAINNSGQNFIGLGVPISLSMRNTIRKLETSDISSIVAYEGQPSPINSNEIRGSLHLGSNFSFTYPNISLPFLKSRKYNLMNPKSAYSFGVDYSEPFWGNRFNVNSKINYSWQPSQNKRFFISLFDLALINTKYDISDPNSASTLFYNELVKQQKNGNNLKVTFDPQFVSSFSTSFLYNNQNVQERYGNSKYFRLFLESGGTIMNLFKNKDEIAIIEKLFPLNNKTDNSDSVRAYFRFVKINADYRRYYSISPKSGWAYRINVGVINPYGKNHSVPYDKNFFAGGSNSIRAWSPLSLGVGSAAPDVTSDGNIIPQPGDILLESNIEYRQTVANFFGDIQLATFIDAGNIWKWYQVPTKLDKANFDINRFYKEFAVGTGFGIRWDLTYFLMRFDWGIKVIDPSRNEKDRFVLDEFSLRKNSPYGLQLQIGIGYPF